jgi:hypothetical protein
MPWRFDHVNQQSDDPAIVRLPLQLRDQYDHQAAPNTASASARRARS